MAISTLVGATVVIELRVVMLISSSEIRRELVRLC